LKLLSFFDLKSYNTFGVKAEASLFVEVREADELQQVLESSVAAENEILILGSGSNILFTRNFDGLVIHNNIKGIKIIEENEEYALTRANAGEIWHELVEFAIGHDLGGIENLSLIPGTVGAAPIQNIGAYGVELKEVMVSLEAIEKSTGTKRIFRNEECKFGYRDSVFKNELKDQYVITSVDFRLLKNAGINTSYGAIKDVLKERGIAQPGIRDVSSAVIAIRQSKLPDPAEIGNAGSFFKNPVIDKLDFEGLKLEFPEIPGYPGEATVKVPAAWLIDQAGWKGITRGNIGVHKNQPLVLVNYGGGSGMEIYNLAMEVQASVAQIFGIELEPEPRII
jgi:UDP-N-acetylmuramate dehydrogenase